MQEKGSTERGPLALEEKGALAHLEATVQRGFRSFLEAGQALSDIRDRRLYRATHASFAAYCQERWGLNRRRAYQLMGATSVVAALKVSTIVDTLPDKEAQTRPLQGLSPEVQREAWEAAVANSGGSPTAKDVQAAVRELADQGTRGEKDPRYVSSPGRRKSAAAPGDDLEAELNAMNDEMAEQVSEQAQAVPRPAVRGSLPRG